MLPGATGYSSDSCIDLNIPCIVSLRPDQFPISSQSFHATRNFIIFNIEGNLSNREKKALDVGLPA